MKFLDEFKDIEFENIGSWPTVVKVVFAIFLAILIFVGSYYLGVSSAIDTLHVKQGKEKALRTEYKNKYQLAANLKLYEDQLKQIKIEFAKLLKMLPLENEMPGLLDDITFAATDAGLTIHSLEWQKKVPQEFYYEFPIKMSVSGNYHQMGKFVSGVADLPRIVSLHDFTIQKNKQGQLDMEILAKTYRFRGGTRAPTAKTKTRGKK